MKKKMRWITAAVMAAAMMAMSGCGGTRDTGKTTADTEGTTAQYTVGIIQQLEHNALDEATRGFQDKMKEKLQKGRFYGKI